MLAGGLSLRAGRHRGDDIHPGVERVLLPGHQHPADAAPQRWRQHKPGVTAAVRKERLDRALGRTADGCFNLNTD